MQRPKGENYADDLLENVCDFAKILHVKWKSRIFAWFLTVVFLNNAAHSVAAKYCHKQTRDVVSKVLPYTTPKRTYNQDPYHKYLTKGLRAGYSTLSLSNLAKSPRTKKGSKA